MLKFVRTKFQGRDKRSRKRHRAHASLAAEPVVNEIGCPPLIDTSGGTGGGGDASTQTTSIAIQTAFSSFQPSSASSSYPYQRQYRSHHHNQEEDEHVHEDLLTFFQAAPLAYLDSQRIPRAVDALDLDYERSVLVKTLKEATGGGNRIAVSFEMATTDRLGAFLARGAGRVLHFSCHGHPDYLAVDDGWGGLQCLEVPRLKTWIRQGGGRLKFVFVSACHSHSIGQAFVEAKVPHVVCCSQGIANVRSDTAVEFEKAFYRALACGNVLQKAFDLACQEVMNCPFLEDDDRAQAGSHFCLLPADKDHNVPIFFTKEPLVVPAATVPTVADGGDGNSRVSPTSPTRIRPFTSSSRTKISSMCSTLSSSIRHGVAAPEVLIGRNVDKFRVLQAIKSFRLVRVSGPSGIGKSTLVKACCLWIGQRNRILDIDEILWVPPLGQQCNEEGLMGWFADVFQVLQGDDPIEAFRDACADRLRKIVRYLLLRVQDNKYVLLVIEAKDLLPLGRGNKLAFFIEKLLQQTPSYVKIILIHRDGDSDWLDTRRMPCVESVITVNHLDMESTIKLFSLWCRHVANRVCPAVGSRTELLKLLLPQNECNSSADTSPRLSKRLSTIFKMLGNGIPDKVRHIAKHMTTHEYKQLIAIGQQEEGDIQFQSRAELLQRADELKQQIFVCKDQRNFDRAHRMQVYYDEIEWILQQLPSIHILRQRLDTVKWELDVAVSEENWAHAATLKHEYGKLESEVRVEQNALVFFGKGDQDPSAVDQHFETRADIDARMEHLRVTLQRAASFDDFDLAEATDKEIRSLEAAQPLFPSQTQLSDQISRLESQLQQSKDDRLWDKARLVHGRLEVVRNKLEFEIRAERAHADAAQRLLDSGYGHNTVVHSYSAHVVDTTPPPSAFLQLDDSKAVASHASLSGQQSIVRSRAFLKDGEGQAMKLSSNSQVINNDASQQQQQQQQQQQDSHGQDNSGDSKIGSTIIFSHGVNGDEDAPSREGSIDNFMPGATAVLGPNAGSYNWEEDNLAQPDQADTDYGLPVAYCVSTWQLKQALKQKKERMWIRIRREILLEAIHNFDRKTLCRSEGRRLPSIDGSRRTDIVLPALDDGASPPMKIPMAVEAETVEVISDDGDEDPRRSKPSVRFSCLRRFCRNTPSDL